MKRYQVHYRAKDNRKGELFGTYNTHFEARAMAKGKGINGLDGIITKIPQDDMKTLKNIANNCETQNRIVSQKLSQIEEIIFLHLDNEYVSGMNRVILDKILGVIHRDDNNDT